MPGPTAKDSSVRARRNQTSTRAVLTKPEQNLDAEDETPKLPDTIEWYPDVLKWWADLWSSEARAEWIDADLHLLIVGARLYQMMLDPTTKVTAAKSLASEFRQIMVQFGLTAMARRSLQWEISKSDSEQSKSTTKKAPARKAASKKTADPRARFRVVSGG